ncbi:MAG: acyl-CoA dehydrogenase family protein [Chloroflexi bacterium]|nr:acyl-CoA dehydrogenase family protein [Chloroflexota bacterium]
MNFEVEYTPEQEAFRKEVQSFLKVNVPAGLVTTAAVEAITHEQYLMQRELGRKLGGKGWLFPTYPKEYGGGGLNLDQTIILEEEMDQYGLSLPPYYNSGGNLGAPSILVWGTDGQKRQFLPPIFKGEVRVWQLLTEPGAGSDLASVKTTALRDGDDYVLSGQKIFVGSNHEVDWLWTLAVTDPNAPRHENLSWFMLDASLPGITIQPLDLLTAGGEGGAGSGVKNSVFFDDVRAPASALVGGENNGWKVATTHLELEHGGGGHIGRNRLWERLLHYCMTHELDGRPMTKDQDIRDLLMDIYIDIEIGRLFGVRNYFLTHAKKARSYEGPQSSMWRKSGNLRIAGFIQKILGYLALTTDPAHVVEEGHIELHQRSAIVGLHPGGTVEVQKLIMARRIGIGRTVREEAGRLA